MANQLPFEIEVFENLCDSEFNDICKLELTHNARWLISNDDVPEGYSDSGFTCCTYNIDPNHRSLYTNTTLTAWAWLIFNKVLIRSGKFKNPNAVRFLWNYYNKASNGSYHKDLDDNSEKAFSIVYYLDDSDGGTYVEDHFFPSKQGTAILFPSQCLHRGVGPKENNNRFVLNIMFTDN